MDSKPMICGICLVNIEAGETTTTCQGCAKVYHFEHWNENGGCLTYGCAYAPKTGEAAPARNDAQSSHWGATMKACPMCAETIGVSETNCRHCGTDLGTTQPVTSEEIKAKFTAAASSDDGLAKRALAILIVSIFGITGPFNLLIGGIWYARNRAELKRAFPLHSVLAAVGLVISVMYTVLIVIALFQTD